MKIFQTIDSKTFRYNGLKYIKNFIIIPHGLNNISVYNAYDNRFQLMSSTHYSDVQVNGIVYTSQIALIDVLAPILFLKGGVGGDVESVNGKTGVVIINKADIGLGNVDNTSDANKPVSTAQQIAINAGGVWSAGTGTNAIKIKNNQNDASGNYSLAAGYQTIASGTYSYSEGYQTQATGYTSHAEGELTKAFGSNSHAEGLNTQATGGISHAEGVGTIASGGASHAQGDQTKATGTNAHAEGFKTLASGNYSHAQGNQTSATTNYATAQGIFSQANGESSFASGTRAIANGNFSFVHGSASTATADNTIVLGARITGTTANTTFVDGLNIKSVPAGSSVNNLGIDSTGKVVIAVINKNDIGLGNVDNTSDINKPISNPTQVALNLKANIASPVFSWFAGIDATILSPSTAFTITNDGTVTTSIQKNGFIKASRFELFGGTANQFLMANGSTLTANFLTENNHVPQAIARFGSATGTIEQSMIYESAGLVLIGANGTYDADVKLEITTGKVKAAGFKIPSGTSSQYLMADGSVTTSSGGSSYWSAGTGTNAIVMINSTNRATATGALAEGQNAVASGFSSHAEGQSTVAGGNASHAEGGSTKALGDSSHAEGSNTIASGGFGSHAEGSATQAIGNASHAQGDTSIASGPVSFASGISSKALGSASFVHGNNSQANSANTIVFGLNITGTTANTTFVDRLSIKTYGAYANDAAADADSLLPSGGLYTLTGSRVVYRKP
ncbi:hypothetical protein FNW52_12490 [Flavobacterium sp. ZT3R18]|uniref:hypothetical protein n=1 Tax=Flavobacterium sp. ZT3R18 TaxID=2594429 RepID=UPI00117BBFC0|nr:hypothetical protein [Flavobacterium sp. ZT3R18]TRX34953.1 hypothetical protein FNW52_12490 [Flavobacterium sp. ZT3R18]